MGKKTNKDIIYKKSTIDRNREKHPDLSKDDYNKVLKTSLYNRKFILPSKKDKSNYHNIIGRIKNKIYSSVVLDTDDKKDKFEVVHTHKIKSEGVKRLIKQSKNEKKE